jgi:hypothetical protein
VSTGGSISIGGSGSNAGAATGGSPGNPPVCHLPFETGPCSAAFQRYGFNPQSGHCEKFLYGGCGGNANNFESLEACEDQCGGSALGNCPQKMPAWDSPCVGITTICHYAPNDCLCVPKSIGVCDQIDPNCNFDTPPPPPDVPGCSGADCPAPVVLPTLYTCACMNGAWSCAL